MVCVFVVQQHANEFLKSEASDTVSSLHVKTLHINVLDMFKDIEENRNITKVAITTGSMIGIPSCYPNVKKLNISISMGNIIHGTDYERWNIDALRTYSKLEFLGLNLNDVRGLYCNSENLSLRDNFVELLSKTPLKKVRYKSENDDAWDLAKALLTNLSLIWCDFDVKYRTKHAERVADLVSLCKCSSTLEAWIVRNGNGVHDAVYATHDSVTIVDGYHVNYKIPEGRCKFCNGRLH